MRMEIKVGWAVLALALSCAAVKAQDRGENAPANAGPDVAVNAAGNGPEEFAGGPDNLGALLGFTAEPEEGPGPDEEGPAVEGPEGPGARGPMGPGGERGRWGGERGGFGRGGHDRGFAMMRLLNDPAIREKAGISEEQVAKIRQQAATFRKTEIRQRADLEVKRVDLRELLSADKPDRSAIDSKLGEISASQLALEKSRVGFRLDLKNAITPEQRDKLRAAIRERWQSERGGPGRSSPGTRGQRGPGGRGGPEAAPAPDAQGKPGE